MIMVVSQLKYLTIYYRPSNHPSEVSCCRKNITRYYQNHGGATTETSGNVSFCAAPHNVYQLKSQYDICVLVTFDMTQYDNILHLLTVD